MANNNGHPVAQVAESTRELMLAKVMDGLTQLLGVTIETSEHPVTPGMIRFSVRIGPIIATRDETKFKLQNNPHGELVYSAALLGVCLKDALSTYFHSEAATFLAPYLAHKSDCAVRSCERGEEFGPCSCGLDQLIVKAKPSSPIEVVGEVPRG